MNTSFGSFVRERREKLLERDGSFTLRQTARKIGFQPSYLSKIEREEVPPPPEGRIKQMAVILGLDPDFLLALAGKVSEDLRSAIIRRPHLFARLIRQLKDAPDETLNRVVQETTPPYGYQNQIGNEHGIGLGRLTGDE